MILIRVLFQTVFLAIGQIWSNKIRSMLTTLGIIIGVAAVIAVVGVLSGLEQQILDQFDKFGTKRVFIGGKRPDGIRGHRAWREVQLTLEEVQAIDEHVESLTTIMPLWYGSYRIENGDRAIDGVRVAGIWPVWHDIENRQILNGRPFSALDEELRRQVCLINEIAIEGFARILKRLEDIVVSILLLVITCPLWIVLALLIKGESPGPILFHQKRVGKNGRTFKMYKFRSMYQDADMHLQKILQKDPKRRKEWEANYKLKDDPRITWIGRFLRKSSLDELPQLWNVLKGDMSLVGPRPPLPTEVDLYQGWQRRRLSMRPGITCFWQVSGRNKITDFNEWVKLDLKYIDQWTFWLDFKILYQTIPAVVKGTGV